MDEGFTTSELAAELGFSPQHIRRTAKSLNIVAASGSASQGRTFVYTPAQASVIADKLGRRIKSSSIEATKGPLLDAAHHHRDEQVVAAGTTAATPVDTENSTDIDIQSSVRDTDNIADVEVVASDTDASEASSAAMVTLPLAEYADLLKKVATAEARAAALEAEHDRLVSQVAWLQGEVDDASKRQDALTSAVDKALARKEGFWSRLRHRKALPEGDKE